MEYDEIFEDTWEAKANEWLPYVKNDVISIVSCYIRYTMGMEELKNFGIKNSLTLPSLAKKHFISLRDEKDELIYTFTDTFMKIFLRQSIKGGRCIAFNQHYKSIFSNKVFNNISIELDKNGNICETLEKYF